MQRRKYLALASLTLSTAVAGCSGDDEASDDGESTPEPTDTPTDTPEPTPEPTDTPTDTPEPTPEPTDTPEPTPEPEPSFQIDSVSVSGPVVTGREIEVAVVVKNTGLADGETTVQVSLGDSAYEKTVSVAAERQNEAKLSFTVEAPAGEYDMQITETATGAEAIQAITVESNEPAFTITGVDIPGGITRYETRNIGVTVANEGYADGDATLLLSVADNEWQQSVSVPAGESAKANFEVTIEFSAGTYDLTVAEQSDDTTVTRSIEIGKHPGDKQLDKAHDKLVEVLDIYTGFPEDGDTLLDVNASVKVNGNKIERNLLDAREMFRNARDQLVRERQEVRKKKLEGVHWFFWWFASYQEPMYDSHRNIRFAWKLLLSQANFSPSGLSNARSFANEAEEPLTKLKDNSEAADFEAFDPLAPEDYEAKLEDIGLEMQAPRQWDEFFYELEFVVKDIERGIEEFKNGNYSSAEEWWEPSFEQVDIYLNEQEWAPAYDPQLEDANCIVDGLKAGTDELVELAEFADDDDNDAEAIEDKKSEPRSAFRECEMTFDISPTLEEFLNAD